MFHVKHAAPKTTAHGSKPATAVKGKGGKGGKARGGTDRETHAPPMHITPEFQRIPDAHKTWTHAERDGRSLWYWRINTSLYEVCLEVGGPTSVRTWDDIQRYLDGTLSGHQASYPTGNPSAEQC